MAQKSFVEKAYDMRLAQKNFFSSKAPSDFVKAKALEREFDAALHYLLRQPAEKREDLIQLSMF